MAKRDPFKPLYEEDVVLALARPFVLASRSVHAGRWERGHMELAFIGSETRFQITIAGQLVWTEKSINVTFAEVASIYNQFASGDRI